MTLKAMSQLMTARRSQRRYRAYKVVDEAEQLEHGTIVADLPGVLLGRIMSRPRGSPGKTGAARAMPSSSAVARTAVAAPGRRALLDKGDARNLNGATSGP